DVGGTQMLSAAAGAEFSDMCIAGDLIISPGVTGEVVLTDVTVEGAVMNFGEAEVTIETTEEEQEEEVPAIRPEEVYTPTKTTGETIIFREKYEVPVYEDRRPIKVKEGDFEWEGDRLVYTGRRFDTRFGIDVSAYQNRATEGGIDWEAVADDGVEFVMVRAGFRGTSTGSLNADAFYGENIEGAMDAGLETGVYFFAQAITVEEAIEEAEFVLELLEDYDIDGPVAYDWEMHDATYRVYGTSPEMATACAIAFCERIEEAGYDAMIYAGSYVSYLKYDQGAIEPYLSWYPEYKTADSEVLAPTFLYQMDYWQFSSNCTVDGITGRVDGNIHFY
ncbi:MAG: glycoside hydrolase family 25 protein, partial [Oscillibacter sp.]|nr:glycoside hydrolase family 25 protein [Oscillibacter sp.]